MSTLDAGPKHIAAPLNHEVLRVRENNDEVRKQTGMEERKDSVSGRKAGRMWMKESKQGTA